MKKSRKKLFLIILAVLVGVFFLKNAIIKTAITTVGSNVVGAPLTIKKFSLSLFTQKVHIKGMKLYNPKGFPKEPLVNIPEIRVDYKLGALLNGKLHLPLIIFDLKEMVIIKDKNGMLNVDALKIAQVEEKPEGKPGKDGGMMPMQIDELRLNVERVIFKDYSTGEKPDILAYEVALKNKVFKNIQSPQQLATLVMVQAMGPTAIQGAKIYAAATLVGAAFLPAGVVGVLVGKDYARADFSKKYDKVYEASLKLLQELGELKSDDRSKGAIRAKVSGNDVAVDIKTAENNQVRVTVSARKLMVPKQEFAGGILYQIENKL